MGRRECEAQAAEFFTPVRVNVLMKRLQWNSALRLPTLMLWAWRIRVG